MEKTRIHINDLPTYRSELKSDLKAMRESSTVPISYRVFYRGPRISPKSYTLKDNAMGAVIALYTTDKSCDRKILLHYI